MDKTIQVLDKTFRPYLSEDEIQKAVEDVAKKISCDFNGKDVLLCPVLTGSYIFAADLARQLTFDPDVAFVRYNSYQGTHSTGHVTVSLPFPEKCRGRHVIIVEDIVDSGITMEYLLNELHQLHPMSISICTFLFKPDNFQKSFKIDYIGLSIPNNFILGYGLDYNGKGRSYKSLYVIDE